MDNFASIVRHLTSQGAVRTAADGPSLEREIAALLRAPALREAMGSAAQAALATHAGATVRTARWLIERR